MSMKVNVTLLISYDMMHLMLCIHSCVILHLNRTKVLKSLNEKFKYSIARWKNFMIFWLWDFMFCGSIFQSYDFLFFISLRGMPLKKASLTNWVDQESNSNSCNKSWICNNNLRAHTQMETKLPLTTHVTSYTK